MVKKCIKNNIKFESQDAQTKKLKFAGRAAAPLEDRTIRLVDFIHIMLELQWSSLEVRTVILNYCKKGKMERNDLRELFLLFAIKRKIKLMSFLVNSEEFKMEVDENNFIDIIENSAYDIGVLVYREYFLLLNTKTDKIVNLLIKAFTDRKVKWRTMEYRAKQQN